MPRQYTPVICPYCGCGCGLYLVSEDGKYAGIKYWKDHPFNRGKLCPKGNDLSFLVSKDRLKKPLKRTESGWKEISWREAIREISERLREYSKKYGGDVIGFLASARCFNEENYALQKLARLLGSPNIDHCARLCHAATVHALIKVVGTGAISATFDQILESDVIFIVGYNGAVTHPVLFGQYILKAKQRGAKLIVADPVLSETAMKADLHLQHYPGTDIPLLLSIAHVIIREGMVDEEFIEKYTEGFEAFKVSAMKWPPEKAAEVTGVPADKIVEAAYMLGKAEKGSVLWGMGLTQHVSGTDNVMALAMIAALRGWWGKPGCAIGGVRGQNNVQGACDMGCLAEYYPGYVPADDKEKLRRIAELWGVDVDSLPGVGLTVVEMAHAAEAGKLKMMYIMGENPMRSDPNLSHVEKALKKLEFLVVQDIFPTETTELADIVLPAAAWAEKEGTFTAG
ncbi:MAG TPA: formate dehydrogenase subunit alpha, partial [Pyrodictium sp.]|nr:formate dehydrogenase subunit alpha [Pyrodictium sp.]